MRKIMLGLIQTSLSPFIIIIGSYAIKLCNTDDKVAIFAGVLGSISIVFNFIIGLMLIAKGYQETEAFKGW